MKKWYVALALLMILAVYCAAIFFANDITIFLYGPGGTGDDILTRTGQLGDSAGAINALFSALAFFGVLWAIFLQREELQLQRKELEMTREELKGQKMEFEAQNETLRRQRFENTFFNMLSSQQDIIEGIALHLTKSNQINKNVPDEHFSYSGRDVFVSYYEQGNMTYFNSEQERNITIEGGMKQAIFNAGIDAYRYSKSISCFDHYFRHLYRIIKFVDESMLLPNSFEERYHYVAIVRAHLSDYELVWLFYNGIARKGGDNQFKALIEKYALLKNMRFELLASHGHRDLYAPSAFEKTPSIE